MLAFTVQFSSYGRDPDPVIGACPTEVGGSSEGRSAPAGLAGTEVIELLARSLRTQQRAWPPAPHDRFRFT
jgi:hypothetical protein